MESGGYADRKQHVRSTLCSPDFFAVWLCPLLVFVVTLLLFSHTFDSWPVVAIGFAFVGLCLSLLLIHFSKRAAIFLPLGLAGLPALAIGVVLGLYLYDSYYLYTTFYAHSQRYTNVVPSESSGSIADAGRIVFSPESTIDFEAVMSYREEDGTIYCAAPVIDDVSTKRINFWAVGVDCCKRATSPGTKGTFTCDDALDTTAHSGVVIFENRGLFADAHLTYYDKARKQAEAAFGFRASSNPLYVRWVRQDRQNMLSDYYNSQTGVYTGIFVFDYLIFSALVSLGLNVVLSKN